MQLLWVGMRVHVICSSIVHQLLCHFPFSGHYKRWCLPAFFIIMLRSCDCILTNGLCSISRAGKHFPFPFHGNHECPVLKMMMFPNVRGSLNHFLEESISDPDMSEKESFYKITDIFNLLAQCILSYLG